VGQLRHRIHACVRGRVQGVSFRASAQMVAVRLGLSGWVRNQEDGNVEIEAEGDREVLERFLAWCRRGPSAARVLGVEVQWLPATGEHKSFNVRY
jgi:acylphosphatase